MRKILWRHGGGGMTLAERRGGKAGNTFLTGGIEPAPPHAQMRQQLEATRLTMGWNGGGGDE